jgi:hypothetical protein
MLRTLVLTVSVSTLAVYGQSAAGARPYGPSAGGFGNVMFPGGAPGHRVTDTSFGGRLGATVRGVPPQGPAVGGGGRGNGGGRAPVRSVIVPFPVYATYPYGYGYGEPQQQQYVEAPPQQQQQPPVVIINQNYRPDTVNPQVRDYSDANLPQPPTLKVYENRTQRAIEEDKPTIFLIAMKDGSIMPALAFWVEGDTLNYITRESSHNRISLDRVDRDFSSKLNQERGLEFRIP